MDLKTRIRVALGIEEETTQLAYEGKLADGTIIVSEADALAEGVAVNVLVEDGTQIPLPVGEYETEDGMKFIVEEEGIVASMMEEAEEEPLTLEPGQSQVEGSGWAKTTTPTSCAWPSAPGASPMGSHEYSLYVCRLFPLVTSRS